MTSPADLVALRALVKAGDSLRYRLIVQVAGHGVDMNRRLPPSVQQAVDRWDGVLPAAREALERVETMLAQYALTGRYGNPFDPTGTKTGIEMSALRARLARVEKALGRYGRHLKTCEPPATPSTSLDSLCTCGFDTALKDQSNDADTAKWQRVHRPVIQGDAAVTSEASAQAARDVAYWRKRAESAEALAIWQETRMSILEEGNQ